MHKHAQLHHRTARAAFDFPDPIAIVSALAAPFAKPDHDGPKTVTQKVYMTMVATFDGPIGGMSTVKPEIPTTDSPPANMTPNLAAATSSTEDPGQNVASASGGSTMLLASIVPSSTSLPSTLVAVKASPGNQFASSSSSPATPSTSSIAFQDTSSGNMSTGAKAGIALSVILLIGVIAVLLLFCIRQRRKAAVRQPLDDEKSETEAFGADRVPSVRSVRTASTAPRLSLRPVTQFQPNLAGSHGIAMSSVSPLTTASPSPDRLSPQSAWERPMTSDSQNRANPFGSHAEPIDVVNAAGPPIVDGVSPSEDVIATAAPAAGTAGAAETAATIGLARSASKLGNGPKPLDLTKSPKSTGLPSPALTEFSMSEALRTPSPTVGAATIAAAGGPKNSHVHRVQLDFNPSMDDELPLRAGQLIRLLHEYDDGWALCIRLDRSAQGVVPRTCLSMRPVKPRPQQPRGNPPVSLRPGAQSQQSRSASPAVSMGHRSASPASDRPSMGGPGPQYNPQGRPMTPTSVRSSSPSSHRPQSPAQQNRRNTPPGPSPIARDGYGFSPPSSFTRKPVPGQAI